MHINPSSSVSGHHQRSDQARPAESPNNARPEASTTSRTSTGCFNTGFANLKRLFGKQAKCAPSDSHEAASAEDIAASSQSGACKGERATSSEPLPDLLPEIQQLIVEKAAVVPSLPEESDQKLARLATVSKVFRESVQDIQESHLDIKRAGTRERQDSVMSRIRAIIALASVNGVLPTTNHVHVKEEIKKLLAGEPHVGVSFPLRAKREEQLLLLEILSEKEDMESLHLDVSKKIEEFWSGYMLRELKKINANNPNLHDVTLNIQGEGDSAYLDTEEAQALADALEEISGFQSLILGAVGINAVGMQVLADALKKNKTLNSLDLSYVHLDAAGVKALADALKENHSLQSLNLTGVHLDTDGVKALADALKENHGLQSLDLSYVCPDTDGVKALADALKENHSLQSLNLSEAPLDAAGVQALADVLKENSGLQSLNLSFVRLDAASVQALADALKENHSLQSLNLSEALLDAASVQALADALKENHGLQSLDLKRVKLSDDVVQTLANALKEENCALQSLGLSHTELSGNAVQALAEALKKNKTLKSLDLSRNPKGCEQKRPGIFPEAQALADALKENSGLLSLDLTNTSLKDEGAHALAEALQKNKTLEVLNLSRNKFSPEGVEALISDLKENETLHSLVLSDAFSYGDAVGKRLVEAIRKDFAAWVRL